jgi:uncharacterized membrane protein YkvA (DUF1232 family)
MAEPAKTTATRRADPTVLMEIWRSAQLIWRLMLDARVSLLPKLIVPLVILYVLSPLDLIPDVLVGLGQLDDIAILFFGTKLFINLCPPDVVMEHRRALSGGTAANNKDYVDGTYRFVDED